MKIISTFKDCYDFIQAQGHDDGLLYIRKTQVWSRSNPKDESPYPNLAAYLHDHACGELLQESELKELLPKDRDSVGQLYSNWSSGTLFFCGHKYPILYTPSPNTMDFKPSILSMPQLQKVSGLKFDDIPRMCRKSLEPLPISESLKEMMIASRVPAMFVTRYQIFFNPSLRNLGFDTLMAPSQIGQELMMFFGNIASPDDTPIKIADKDRIAQHGFDKWSFRKQSPDVKA